MQSFRKFLRGFKKKYRMAFDADIGVEYVSGQDGAETKLYEDYLRTMRLTVRSLPLRCKQTQTDGGDLTSPKPTSTSI